MRTKMDENEREEKRQRILSSAKAIVEQDGLEGISIRKVAKQAGYTEGSIYNYFDNKQILIHELIQEGYHELMKAAFMPVNEQDFMETQIIERFKAYTKTALTMPDYYQAVMLSSDPEIVKMTAILTEPAGYPSRGIHQLAHLIDIGIGKGEFQSLEPLKIAKTIWSLNFGVTMRLIVEQTDALSSDSIIEEQLKLIFQGLRKKEDPHGD